MLGAWQRDARPRPPVLQRVFTLIPHSHAASDAARAVWSCAGNVSAVAAGGSTVISRDSSPAAVATRGETARSRLPTDGTRTPPPTRGVLEPTSVVPSAAPGAIEFNIVAVVLRRALRCARKNRNFAVFLSLFPQKKKDRPHRPIVPNRGKIRGESGTIRRGPIVLKGGEHRPHLLTQPRCSFWKQKFRPIPPRRLCSIGRADGFWAFGPAPNDAPKRIGPVALPAASEVHLVCCGNSIPRRSAGRFNLALAGAGYHHGRDVDVPREARPGGAEREYPFAEVSERRLVVVVWMPDVRQVGADTATASR
jgi:hypothetical protein